MTKGFILAAGFSKRLRPISELIPKPLLPVAGEIILEYVYRLLRESGINTIGVNLHYKADEIEKFIKQRRLELELFHERELLGTGGALWNARDFLKDSIFVVHNSDIFWDGNIKEAIDFHTNSGNSITLLVHHNREFNKLIIDRDGNLLGITDEHPQDDAQEILAFTGVAVYSPDVLDLLPEGASSVIELWLKAKAKGYPVRIFKSKYKFWHDIGTPKGYARAVFERLRAELTSIYVSADSEGCELIIPEGKVVIERNVQIKKPVRAKNVIFLPNTVFTTFESIEDSIVCGQYIVSISGWHENGEALTSGGSSRNYRREKGKVLCLWQQESPEFESTVKIGRFLRERGFPVPEIIEVDREGRKIVFEDLGDLTLYSWLQCQREKNQIERVYGEIIRKVAYLHSYISEEALREGLSLPSFSHDYFRWESDYFLKECVESHFQVKVSEFGDDFLKSLTEELDLIAGTLSRVKKVMLHRDLQSQNIMIRDNSIYFIDFQSSRWGPPGYDLASLLWDPYVELDDSLRDRLVRLYLNETESTEYDTEKFYLYLSLCRIQRHMQALGAYGFLSLRRGKRGFLKFIPRGLKLLWQDLYQSKSEFKALRELVEILLNR